MTSAQVVEQLGLTFTAVEVVRNQTVLAVMSASAPFYLYHPAMFSSPESVLEYLHEAKAADNGQFQLSMTHCDGPLVTEEFSKMVVLTQAEGLQLKGFFDKAMELQARTGITSRAYSELLDEFDELKDSFDLRAALFEPTGIEELTLQ
ncbi:hypothetical protein [Burkholderia ubonensis]|uniref:hypothetical protein n=1 Tax=Burkholderia ubonensis TaxID=101571 RepID=UPI0012FB09CB|nr:hypothetical protein [Burkholderia ubonensis]